MTSLTTSTEMPFRGIVANSSDPGPQSVAPPSQVSPHCSHAEHSFNAIQLPSQSPTAPSVVPSADFNKLVFNPQHFKSLINSIKNEMDNGRFEDLVLSDTICQLMQEMSEALLSEVFADANLIAIRDHRLTVTPNDMRASATGKGRNLINFNIKKMREEEERSHEDEEMTGNKDASDPEKETVVILPHLLQSLRS
ncbi:hypothetical protein D6D01_09861 [Aureobasidium pullulans]|uniref:Core Histone H2A/H2B/H3 domain-containing protein n=1 Tax=Aureobasidium pullulans TaxID=5580 RepID=A0A4S9JWJ9_AURPU|nr:hypothetical protein D6D01_09861 [Aureobasidium pullulans]